MAHHVPPSLPPERSARLPAPACPAPAFTRRSPPLVAASLQSSASCLQHAACPSLPSPQDSSSPPAISPLGPTASTYTYRRRASRIRYRVASNSPRSLPIPVAERLRGAQALLPRKYLSPPPPGFLHRGAARTPAPPRPPLPPLQVRRASVVPVCTLLTLCTQSHEHSPPLKNTLLAPSRSGEAVPRCSRLIRHMLACVSACT